MITPDYALVSAEGVLIGFPESAEEALAYMWEHPGTQGVPIEQLALAGQVHGNEDAELMAQSYKNVTGSRPVWSNALKLVKTIMDPSDPFYPNKKIQAIKETRSVFAIGLGEAKAVIDQWFAELDKKYRAR